MTLYIQESALTVQFTLNQVNLTLGALYDFVITSQYSHQPVIMGAVALDSNDRYTTFETTFPIGFGDQHKNGIYYWELLLTAGDSIEKGLIKIITEPGGNLGTINYDSGTQTEERVADVFYRPNY